MSKKRNSKVGGYKSKRVVLLLLQNEYINGILRKKGKKIVLPRSEARSRLETTNGIFKLLK
jgi:hypothetical protein